MYTWVVLVPLVQSANYSLYSWDGVSTPTWVGLGNYGDFFTDPDLRAALGHVGVLICFFSFLPIVARPADGGDHLPAEPPRRGAVPLAAASCRRSSPPSSPRSCGSSSTPRTARSTRCCGPLGLGALAQNWLGDVTWALPALGVIGTWVTFGFCMILFVSGAQSIPQELYEAARIDGAAPVARVLRGHPARPAPAARRRADPDDHRRPAHLRPRLRRHPGRPGVVDHHAGAAALPQGVPEPRRRRRGGHRRRAGHRLPARRDPHPARHGA